MLKFLKVTSAPEPIPLGCELPTKPKKRLVIPKKGEPTSDTNLFSQQLWELYDSCHYWMKGSSRQNVFHKHFVGPCRCAGASAQDCAESAGATEVAFMIFVPLHDCLYNKRIISDFMLLSACLAAL